MPNATSGTTGVNAVSDHHRTEVLSRRIACTNRIWNVFFTHVKDGQNEVADYLVMEPKVRTAGDVTGVAVLPVLDGRIGLLKVSRVALNAVFIEAPKGFVEPGEDEATAALRELVEETGLVCDRSDLVALGSVTPEASTLATRTKLFAALRCRPSAGKIEDEVGLGGLDFITLERVRVMAAGDEIEDATTVSALYRLFAKADTNSAVAAALTGRQS